MVGIYRLNIPLYYLPCFATPWVRSGFFNIPEGEGSLWYAADALFHGARNSIIIIIEWRKALNLTMFPVMWHPGLMFAVKSLAPVFVLPSVFPAQTFFPYPLQPPFHHLHTGVTTSLTTPWIAFPGQIACRLYLALAWRVWVDHPGRTLITNMATKEAM